MLACALLTVCAVASATPADLSERWITAFGRTLQWPFPGTDKFDYTGRTYRYVATLAAEGAKVRVRLSNELPEMRDAWMTIGDATIAVVGDERNVKRLTWGGEKVGKAPPGAPLLSDPVDLKVKPLQKVIISVYFPDKFQPLANDSASTSEGRWTAGQAKTNAMVTGKGNFVDQLDAPGAGTTANPLVTGIEVLPVARGWRSVIVLGTSRAGGLDTWPTKITKRAAAQKIALVSISQTAGGMYTAVYGQTDLARLDRDVLARPNVDYLILQTAGDDIIKAGMRMMRDRVGGREIPEPVEDLDNLTSGYSQLIDRAHEHGIKVAGVTIHPWRGATYDTNPLRNVRRMEFINWQKTSGKLDYVIDGVTPVADPATLNSDNPAIAPNLSEGNGRSVNAAGDQAFADSVDLSIFK